MTGTGLEPWGGKKTGKPADTVSAGSRQPGRQLRDNSAVFDRSIIGMVDQVPVLPNDLIGPALP